MTTTVVWTAVWYYWLLAIAVSFIPLELGTILIRHMLGYQNITDWTLSDTIRRWSVAHRWLAPVTVGCAAMLLVHFFGQANP